MRLIDAHFAQHIANVELSKDDAGTVYWVLSHTPTIDPEELRPKGRWILRDDKGNGVCNRCNKQDHIDPLANHCRYCGAKMEVKT